MQNNYDYSECESDFRFFWLKQKLDELHGKMKGNVTIKLLDAHPMSQILQILAEGMCNYGNICIAYILVLAII